MCRLRECSLSILVQGVVARGADCCEPRQDYFSCGSGMCADLKWEVSQTEPQAISTLYRRPPALTQGQAG